MPLCNSCGYNQDCLRHQFICLTLPLVREAFLPMAFIFLLSLIAATFTHILLLDWKLELMQSAKSYIDSELQKAKAEMKLLHETVVKIQNAQKRSQEYLSKIEDTSKTMALTAMDENSTRSAILEELKKYDADKTGMADFALENSGGRILTIRGTKVYKMGSNQMKLFSMPFTGYEPIPQTIIQKSMAPGDCWPFETPLGTVVIQLSYRVHVSHISLEHIPQELSPSRSINSAPKAFSVYGLEKIDEEDPHLFGEFEYDIRKDPLQTFPVQNQSKLGYNLVEFTFFSNHGNPHFTCVYRVRVHGEPFTFTVVLSAFAGGECTSDAKRPIKVS